MTENQLPSPQLTPPIIIRRIPRLIINSIQPLQDGYFMDMNKWYEQTSDHMTTEMEGNSSDDRTIYSDDNSKVDEERTICSDEEDEEEIKEIDNKMDDDIDIESVSEDENDDIEDVSEEDDDDEDNEEIQIKDKETVDETLKEFIDAFFKDKDMNKVKESKAGLAFEILQELIDECILDVAFEMHRQAKIGNFGPTQTYQNQDSKNDIFGQNINTLKLQAGKQSCLNCNAMIPVTTYAKHFSKCLGLIQGRTATRNVRYIDDERKDKFSVFNFPEESPSSSFISNTEMDIDTQETCVTKSHNASPVNISNEHRVIKNTYARRRTMKPSG